jgi:phosphate uptake regulator
MLGIYKNRHFIKVNRFYHDMANSEIRRVQALQGERSLTVVLPKEFATELGISKGDYLKVIVENTRLVLERAEL